MTYLVVSDLDGTLLGNIDALTRFNRWISPRRSLFRLVYASGRGVSRILHSLHEKPLPWPDAIIGDVGGELRGFPDLEPLAGWEERIQQRWDAARVRDILGGDDALEPQPEMLQAPTKVSYYVNDADEAYLDTLTARLRDQGIEAGYIYSSNKDLDILPAGVDKGSAAAHLAERWGFPPDRVIVAGNSGNDASLYCHGFRGVVVSNARDQLKHLKGGEIYHAETGFADGVREGISHWVGPGLETDRVGALFVSNRSRFADEGLRRSLDLLRACATQDGFVAVPTAHPKYRRVWGRDGAIMTLAALMSGETDLVEVARVTLETLARFQGEEGQIPSNVDPVSDRVSYGGTAGRVDASLWFVIACGQYWRRTGDHKFIEQMNERLEQIRFLLRAWEFNRRGLLYVPLTGDWADEYVHSGYVLYDQLLYLRAQQELAAVHHYARDGADHALLERIDRLTHLIQTNYWIDDRKRPDDVYHPTLYDRAKEAAAHRCGAYWMAYFSPASFGYRFDALANVLASLLGVADDEQRRQVDAFIAAEVHPEILALLPAFHPVITPRDAAWDDLQTMFSSTFKNRPYEYQNGGLWPMITGFYVADLAARGELDTARRYLEGIHVANASRMDGRCWSFPEYLHGRNFTPGGKSELAWNAAAAVIGAQALEGMPLFTDDMPSW